MRLYLDNCCFNRPFDDQENRKVALETQAKLYIQDEIKEGKVELVWSYILEFENQNNPHIEIRALIQDWKRYAVADVEESRKLLDIAGECTHLGMGDYDALHVACACIAQCDLFITTDRGILAKSKSLTRIRIVDPVDYINLEMES